MQVLLLGDAQRTIAVVSFGLPPVAILLTVVLVVVLVTCSRQGISHTCATFKVGDCRSHRRLRLTLIVETHGKVILRYVVFGANFCR